MTTRTTVGGHWSIRVRVFGGLLGLLVTTGCGVSTQVTPEHVDLSVVGASHQPRRGDKAGLDESRRAIYLTADRRLVRLVRSVSAYSGVEGSLEELSAGPTAAEADRGVRSALPPGSAALTALISDGVARVRLPASYGEVQGRSQVLAIAQIVYTLTSIDGITRVEFEIDGRPIDVPVDRGQLRDRPVSRADYAAVAPLSGHQPQGPHGPGHPRE